MVVVFSQKNTPTDEFISKVQLMSLSKVNLSSRKCFLTFASTNVLSSIPASVKFSVTFTFKQMATFHLKKIHYYVFL